MLTEYTIFLQFATVASYNNINIYSYMHTCSFRRTTTNIQIVTLEKRQLLVQLFN